MALHFFAQCLFHVLYELMHLAATKVIYNLLARSTPCADVIFLGRLIQALIGLSLACPNNPFCVFDGSPKKEARSQVLAYHIFVTLFTYFTDYQNAYRFKPSLSQYLLLRILRIIQALRG